MTPGADLGDPGWPHVAPDARGTQVAAEHTDHGEMVKARNPFRRNLGTAALATAVFAESLGWRVGGDMTTLYVDDLGTVLAALAASLLCFAAGKGRAGELRRFWRLLGAACGAWTLGEAIWAVYDLALREEVPVPSWADVGYLGAIPFAVAALLCHPALAGSGTWRARSMLDGLLVASALLFLSWTLVLGPLWHATDLTTLGGLVAVAYPFGDVMIVFFVVLAVRRMSAGDRLPLWCLLAGLLALALSDSVYAYLTEVQGYEPGGLIDLGWFVGYLAIGVGRSARRPGGFRRRGQTPPHHGSRRSWSPSCRSSRLSGSSGWGPTSSRSSTPSPS